MDFSPRDPKIAGLRMADIDQYQGRAMRLTQPMGTNNEETNNEFSIVSRGAALRDDACGCRLI